ncbi:hypothetical protein [Arthrobacter sp. IK3]|uniref:hypothetical protein n=1 Tax=Arthrobacter sp. IK3 TaxID=3448169 RepID=UPI003EE1AB6C
MTNTRKKDVGQAGNGGQFAGRDHSEATGVELTAPEHDLTWWDEDGRTFPASLYEAGLDGTLEPYNGDYPVNDGALRFRREDMTRELVIGVLEDGTTVIAVEAEVDEQIYISENVGADPAPEQIIEAVSAVKEQAAGLPEPEEY